MEALDQIINLEHIINLYKRYILLSLHFLMNAPIATKGKPARSRYIEIGSNSVDLVLWVF